MAHLEKLKKSQLYGILTHVGRGVSVPTTVNHSNEMIDPGLSQYNYNLVDFQDGKKDFHRIKERVEDHNVINRKNINWLGSWVITLPQELFDEKDKEKMLNSIQERTSNDQHPLNEDQQKFFKLATDFIKQRYGADNVMYAYVHVDESTPHLHIGFTPCFYDEERKEKVTSFKGFVKRKDYQTFHRDLSKFMMKEFGRDIGIMKSETQAKNAEIERLQAENVQLKQKIDNIDKETDGQLLDEDVHDELMAERRRLGQDQEQALERISQLVQEKKQNIKTVGELKKETQLQEGLNKIAENTYNKLIQDQEQARQELKRIEEQAKQASNQARQELLQAQEQSKQAKDELEELARRKAGLFDDIDHLNEIKTIREIEIVDMEYETRIIESKNKGLEQEIQQQEDKLKKLHKTVADEFGSYADVELENRKLKSENQRLKEKVEFQEKTIEKQNSLINMARTIFTNIEVRVPQVVQKMIGMMGERYNEMMNFFNGNVEKNRQAEEQEKQMQKKTYHDFYER